MNKYIPSLSKVSQEVIATGIALIIVSWLIASSPRLKALVREYQAP
jgi:hypothetical protein